jgi:hypothetical protein
LLPGRHRANICDVDLPGDHLVPEPSDNRRDERQAVLSLDGWSAMRRSSSPWIGRPDRWPNPGARGFGTRAGGVSLARRASSGRHGPPLALTLQAVGYG